MKLRLVQCVRIYSNLRQVQGFQTFKLLNFYAENDWAKCRRFTLHGLVLIELHCLGHFIMESDFGGNSGQELGIKGLEEQRPFAKINFEWKWKIFGKFVVSKVISGLPALQQSDSFGSSFLKVQI